MSKFKRSWMLFKRSMRVIFDNKKLLLFPLVVFILTCVIGLFFLAPIALWDTGYAVTEEAHWKTMANRWFAWDGETGDLYLNPACYVVLAVLYMVSMFLATFINVAFYNEILNALNGRPVSVSGGLRLASTRLKSIFFWSMFTGLVGLIIKSLEERAGPVGRWVVKFIGLAWSVASVFVVPAIVREESHANPVRFLRTSASMLKKTWGESLTGYLGIRFGQVIALALTIGLIALSAYASFALENFWIVGIVSVLCVGFLFAFIYVLGVASHVYMGALYVYASEGVVPEAFDREEMAMAWKVKSGRKRRGK